MSPVTGTVLSGNTESCRRTNGDKIRRLRRFYVDLVLPVVLPGAGRRTGVGSLKPVSLQTAWETTFINTDT